MPLTDVIVRSTKPTSKPYKLADGGGLYILVQPAGGKLWRLDYRFAGKRKTLALGKYPDIGLKDARERRDEARKLLANGADPAETKKAQKAAQSQRAANSLEAIAREWHDVWKAAKSDNYSKKALSRLETDVFPWIGKKPVADITAPDVLSVLRRIEGRGVVETARRAGETLSMVMRYAIATGRRTENDPAPSLRGALKTSKVKHFASLTEPAQVAGLLRAIDSYPGTYPVRAALRLAPMVFVRPGELRAARWDQIDLDGAEWRFIASKTGTGHIVPLARQALEILRDLYPLTGRGEYVFPGLRPGRPISDGTLNKALRSLGYDTRTEITGHGFRAMARTMIAEKLKLNPEFIERQLAHKARGPLGAAYDRAMFIDDRQLMMQAWADYLDKLKSEEASAPIRA